MTGWLYYFPDDGETTDDARRFGPLDKITDADDAAQCACERDFDRHDGWERGPTEFTIAIIAPDGSETRWKAWHEPSVEHYVSEST